MVFFITGCSTATYVKLPADSTMKLKRGDETPYNEGLISRTPLSWSSAGGIPYKIEQNGEVTKEGKLSAKFRVSSIFWPPFAVLYWPMGFRYPCYDLTGETPTACSQETLRDLKTTYRKTQSATN